MQPTSTSRISGLSKFADKPCALYASLFWRLSLFQDLSCSLDFTEGHGKNPRFLIVDVHFFPSMALIWLKETWYPGGKPPKKKESKLLRLRRKALWQRAAVQKPTWPRRRSIPNGKVKAGWEYFEPSENGGKLWKSTGSTNSFSGTRWKYRKLRAADLGSWKEQPKSGSKRTSKTAREII
jgi:hypothetical protein